MRRYRTPVLLALGLGCGARSEQPTGTGTTDASTGITAASHSETGAPTSAAPTPSTTTATSTEPTTTLEFTAGGFIPESDGEKVWPCDPFLQDCREGEKCVAWAEGGETWDALKCVPVTGSRKPGETCLAAGGGLSGFDDCALGAMCWSVDSDTGAGVCVALCTVVDGAPGCPDATACVLRNDDLLNLCLPTCDPLLEDCADDDRCVPDDAVFVCLPPAGSGAVNDPCEGAEGCDAGLVCINAAVASAACDSRTTGCCQPFCEFTMGMTGDCPNPDQQCVQWFDPMKPIPPGLEDVGVCAIPP